MSLLDTLLDPENCENIDLCGPDGEDVSFEQIAVIPLEGTIWFILRPVVPIGNMQEDQALVFFIEEEDEDRLILCEEEDMISKVFDIYYQMLAESQAQEE